MRRDVKKGKIDKGTEPKIIKRKIVPVKGLLGKLTALIYGRSGTGKTTLASTAVDLEPVSEGDRVLLIDVQEEGTDSVYDIDSIDVLPAQTWADYVGAYYYLKDYEHDYKAVIVDTATQLQNIAMIEAKKRAHIPPQGGMNKLSWGHLSGMLIPQVLQYRDLPMHVIFLAQDRRDEMEEDDEDLLLPDVGPALMPSVAKTVNAMVKVIGQTYISQRQVQKKGKLIDTTTYRLRLGPHSSYLTKVRSPKKYKIPSSIPNPTLEKVAKVVRGTYGTKDD